MSRRPQHVATYEDLLRVPDTKIAEIIDGELIVSPRPSSPHARVAFALAATLASFDDRQKRSGEPGGWWILFEPELHFHGPRGLEVLVPDFAGWRLSTMPAMPRVAHFERADSACEIFSPDSQRRDREQKMRIYARERVAHTWLVDPDAHTVEVYRLAGVDYELVGKYSAAEKVRAEPFQQVEIDLARFWL
jgi:Uma2 family endonuclease